MESLLEDLKSIRIEINKAKKLLINPPKEQKLLRLKASLYQVLLLREKIQTKVYATKKDKLIQIINDSTFENLKLYFDKNIKNLGDEDDEIYLFLKEEVIPLLNHFEDVCNNLEQILIPEKIKIIYGEEYNSFINDKKNASVRVIIEKVKDAIINYWLSGGEARGNTLAITDRKDVRLLHAHLPAPIDDYRLVYYYEREKQTLTFLRIARARDLGYTGH